MTVDYEYAAILEFDTLADLTAYLEHDAHEALGALFFEAFDVALMYDYEMGTANARRRDRRRGLAEDTRRRHRHRSSARNSSAVRRVRLRQRSEAGLTTRGTGKSLSMRRV